MMLSEEEMAKRFGYHPPQSHQRVDEHSWVRRVLWDTAEDLDSTLPDGREKSIVLTKIEEAMFWANAALARADDPHAEVSEDEAAAGPR